MCRQAIGRPSGVQVAAAVLPRRPFVASPVTPFLPLRQDAYEQYLEYADAYDVGDEQDIQPADVCEADADGQRPFFDIGLSLVGPAHHASGKAVAGGVQGLLIDGVLSLDIAPAVHHDEDRDVGEAVEAHQVQGPFFDSGLALDVGPADNDDDADDAADDDDDDAGAVGKALDADGVQGALFDSGPSSGIAASDVDMAGTGGRRPFFDDGLSTDIAPASHPASRDAGKALARRRRPFVDSGLALDVGPADRDLHEASFRRMQTPREGEAEKELMGWI